MKNLKITTAQFNETRMNLFQNEFGFVPYEKTIGIDKCKSLVMDALKAGKQSIESLISACGLGCNSCCLFNKALNQLERANRIEYNPESGLFQLISKF